MKKNKIIKDPIYGYVEIPIEYVSDIIDTAVFQRLRRIVQTSYSPLYSSAVHNRFVHSIGVYHLGKIATRYLLDGINSLNEINDKEIFKSYGKIFEIACLLHDVGHAPFSHTGEEFYLDEKKGYEKLHEMLEKLVNIDKFSDDIPKNGASAAAPHEIMSAVIGLKEFEKFFSNNSEKEFFARCITGYEYSDKKKENSVKNCFIKMLNSEIIDVDKLDYLIRDAYITGFDTVSIDFIRLLSSIRVISENEEVKIAYSKSAISIIENVVYAHDAEKKWIQSHPVVLYESYVIKHIISYLNEKVNKDDKKLFSLESLGLNGQELKDNLRISLLCDDDIIFLMKNKFSNELSKEYFERKERRHPVWKSEAEYKSLILRKVSAGNLLDKFEEAMNQTANYLMKNTGTWVIDNKLIEKLENENKKVKNDTNLDIKTKETQLKSKEKILKILHSLQEYANENQIECNFVILTAKQFYSGFGKADFSRINIIFRTKNENKIEKFGEIVSSLEAKDKTRNNFSYLFYKRPKDYNIELDSEDICNKLIKKFI